MESRFNYISVDKDYFHVNDFRIELSNRAFMYGDGFFETMHANGLKVQFLHDHFLRIQKASQIVKLELPEYFTFNFLEQQISGLLSRNKLFQGARIRLIIYRKSSGYYIPDENGSQILIEASYLSKGTYALNAEGINLGIYSAIPKPLKGYWGIKSLNAQLYTLAGIYARENDFDDVCLVSDKGYIVEATSSNIFMVRDNQLLTPPLETGCVEGIMRKQIIDVSQTMGYKIDCEAYICPNDLFTMDEVFLTNAVSGVKYVGGYENRRYFKRVAGKLLNELNNIAFTD